MSVHYFKWNYNFLIIKITFIGLPSAQSVFYNPKRRIVPTISLICTRTWYLKNPLYGVWQLYVTFVVWKCGFNCKNDFLWKDIRLKENNFYWVAYIAENTNMRSGFVATPRAKKWKRFFSFFSASLVRSSSCELHHQTGGVKWFSI